MSQKATHSSGQLLGGTIPGRGHLTPFNKIVRVGQSNFVLSRSPQVSQQCLPLAINLSCPDGPTQCGVQFRQIAVAVQKIFQSFQLGIVHGVALTHSAFNNSQGINGNSRVKSQLPINIRCYMIFKKFTYSLD